MNDHIVAVIVGAIARATEIRQLLHTSDVPTMALPHNFGYEGIAKTCAELRSLRVVAVLCRDYPPDWGVALFSQLKKSLRSHIRLHAIMETGEDHTSTKKRLTEAGVDKIFAEFPLKAFSAASSVKQSWFKGSQRPREVDDDLPVRERRQTPEPRTVRMERKRVPVSAPASIPAPVVATARPLPAASHSSQTAVLERTIVTPPPASPPSLSVGEATKQMEGLLASIMGKVRRNENLPPSPLSVNIVGKNGTVVALDPRRIRRLPYNPRQASNPGFTEESLRTLGGRIKTVGQLEEVMVCPIVGDPNYDAQLVDGERRHRGTELVGIYLYAAVREDLTPEDARRLYILSVMRNSEKEPFTTYDNVKIVEKFREEGMTYEAIEQICNKTAPWVSTHLILGRLSPLVQEMLDGGSSQTKITSRIALLLADIGADEQLEQAKTILARHMNYNQARRYILNVRRGLGLARTVTRGARPAAQFDALRTLTHRNMDAFGIYLDMPSAELSNMVLRQSEGDRLGVCKDIRELATNLTSIAETVERIAKSLANPR